MTRALAGAIVLAFVGNAAAEPVRLHAEAGAFGGMLVVPAVPREQAQINGAIGLRWTLGVAFALPRCLALRVGAIIEAFEPHDGALGAEAQLDGPVDGGIRVGGAVAAASFGVPGCDYCGFGTTLRAGPRVRSGPFSIGADFVVFTNPTATAYGWQLGASVHDDSKMTTGAAIGTAVFAIVVAAWAATGGVVYRR